MLKSKMSERVQEVILPDFPDDDNTVTTVTKSRRVSFGTNFVKEFIVGSAVSGQCLPEYEQAFPSSDSSTADSSHSGVESEILSRSRMFPPHEPHKVHKPVPPVQPAESEFGESRPKLSKFSSTVCFSADSPTADVEFTEGCLTLAKSILEKKNKEMTVFIQAKSKDDEKEKDETKYFDGSQFEMSMTRHFKPKPNKREEKKFQAEKTKIFGKFEDEMSVTRCNRIFNEDEMSMTRCSKIFNNEDEGDEDWEDSKENRMPLDMMIRLLDKDSSDMEKDLFNPDKTLGNFLTDSPLNFSNDSEKLNLNESVDISVSFQSNMFKGPSQNVASPTVEIRKSFREFLESNEEKSLVMEPPMAGNKINEISLNESEEVFASEREAEPILADDKMNITAPPMDLDEVLATGKEPSLVEATVTDQKLSKSNCMELDKVETELSLADISCGDNLNKSTGQKLNESEDVLAPEAIAIVDKSPQRISLDGTDDVLQQAQSEQLEIDDKSNKSQRMSLDGEPSLAVIQDGSKSVVLQSAEDKMSKSPERGSLNEEEDVLASQQEPSLTERQSEPDIEMDVDVEPEKQPLELDKHSVVEPEKQPVEEPEEHSVVEPEKQSVEEPEEQPIVEPPTIRVNEINESVTKSLQEEVVVSEGKQLVADPPAVDTKMNKSVRQSLDGSEEDSTSETEPSLMDLKVVESLKEQSKEPGCVWSLSDSHEPRTKGRWSLSFNCKLLESSTTVLLSLKTSKDDSLDACSFVTNSEMSLNEENHLRLPEYPLVVDFGFQELKKYFDDRRTKMETIRHVPYFMDQINLFMLKTNSYLQQIYSILTLYPGSRLEGSKLSFRLYSFPIFFSCTVSIDLSNLYRLTKSSLSFEHDFGSLDENKIREIFQNCLKCDNSLCEFVVQSTKYLVEIEKESGYTSKRQHIKLLPPELKL